MEKRLPLALLLSALVFIAWSYFMGPRPSPEPPPEPTAAPTVPAAVEPQTEPSAPELPAVGEVVGESEERTVTLAVGTPGEPGSFRAVFSNRGATLQELALANFVDRVGLSDEERADPEHWTRVVRSIPSHKGPTSSLVLRAGPSAEALVRTPLDQALWSLREIENGVEFELAQGAGVRFVKRVLFAPPAYRLRVQLELHNESGGEAVPVPAGRAGFVFTPAEIVPQEAGDNFYQEPVAVAAGRTLNDANANTALPDLDVEKRKEKIDADEALGDFKVPSEVMSFAGVYNKYFAVLMRAGEDRSSRGSLKGATWRRVYDQTFADENPGEADRGWRYIATDVLLELDVPAPGESSAYEYAVYAGPKSREVMLAEDGDMEALLRQDLKAFLPGVETAAGVLVRVLGFFEGLTGNWGIAIILMTVLVRSLLFPLNRRSQTSMARYQKQMKRVQPQIDEIKKKYKDDPEKQRKAQAEIMQKEGLMPPLGGCLPIFVQLPIFFGLFTALRTSFDLRQAPFFGWITDLSKPDQLMRIDVGPLPFIGTIEYLNILPPLMVVLWVAQQMVMPKPADEQAQRMQRMMMFMPVVMGVFLYNYAAGLSLYMITQSLLGILEIGVIKKVWPVDDTPQPKKKGFLARLAEKQQEQTKRMQGMQNAGSATRSQAAKSRKRKKSRRR